MAMDTNLVRTRLLGERDRIHRELDQARRREESFRESAPTNSVGYSNHLADEATQYFEQEKDRALDDNLRRLEDQIELALRKLDRGSYGICEECGESIRPERLEVLPWATTCVRCRARLERESALR
ncbi:MAG: TraR/DksA C4-type zinc finger protein [Chloroflexi bacterium]|nr:TraR/DksA C4-type zinc finger protein [Chloroflexota bacterium]